MKRVLTIAAVSVALIATQAFADADVSLHAGDRVGSSSKTANHLNMEPLGWVVAIAALSGFVFAATFRDHHDTPASP